MKITPGSLIPLIAAGLLAGCAGPAPKTAPPPAPAMPVSKSPTRASAHINAHRFYIITFDPQGVAHDRTGVVVTRERVLTLMAQKDIDVQTGIRIEIPKGITDRDQSIEAFSRAQQVARIFDLLGFQAVVVVLAEK